MTFTFYDERELLPPLLEGIFEEPVWDTFLHRLLSRSRASRICLMLRHGANPSASPIFRQIAASPELPPPDLERLTALGLLPFASLRPSRVYALQELLDYDVIDRRAEQHAALGDAAIAHAAYIRIVGRHDHNAWLLLLSDRNDFTASTSVLLTSLAPLIAAALDTLATIDTLRLRSAMAEDALALLGIGQAAFSHDGRIVAADALATRELALQPQGRSNLPARSAQALAAACAALDGGPAQARQLISGEEGRAERALLLRPAPQTELAMSAAAATGALRQERREDAVSGARILERILGLSAREAALAEAISRGKSIAEAGTELKLTPETARNYSKRIYAKTGTSGQADLVRLLLSGLAPLG